MKGEGGGGSLIDFLKDVLQSLTKRKLIPLRLMAAVSAPNKEIHKKF